MPGLFRFPAVLRPKQRPHAGQRRGDATVRADQFIEEGYLTRNVSTLRKALGESPDGPRYFAAIPPQTPQTQSESRWSYEVFIFT
ncbi:MAG TPA: hypothetical protein VG324_11625 [Blastocatellia bacterium]|nr:hypothetical protein [Blastocatellia bacterium]